MVGRAVAALEYSGTRGASSLSDRSRDLFACRASDSGAGARTAWGYPQAIQLDNGPKFLADRVAPWWADRGIALRCIQPRKPNQYGFIECFNRTVRDKVLVSCSP